MESTAADADRLWEAIQETLRRHGFRLDRVDRPNGVVTTLPETSKHFLEFWRRDVATARDLAESTVNPIRRWVEVRMAPAQAGEDAVPQGGLELSVVVHKERQSCPDRQFNNSGAVYQFFGDSLPATTGTVRVTAEDDRWLDQGRDPALEQRLLRKMLAS